MRTCLRLCLLLPLVLAAACGEEGDDTATVTEDGGATDGTATDGGDEDGGDEDDSGKEEHLDQMGSVMPSFALVDLNPGSTTAGEVVDSADLAGQPYVLIFLDSRCTHVPDLADDIWGSLQAHPEWLEVAPVYGIESSWGYADLPDTADNVVEGNGLPYLLDTEEAAMWISYRALNHDLFVLDADGAMQRWEPLYSWPDDLALFEEVMEELASAAAE